jgi:mRNA interferase MazF
LKRGDLYRVYRGNREDPKHYRVFVVVSRQVVLDSRFSTATCAPVYSQHNDISTQVAVGVDEGLKRDSSIHCDELVSLPKSALTDYVGHLSTVKTEELSGALRIALALEQ